jgi:hypothetical protein
MKTLFAFAAAASLLAGCSTYPKQSGAWEYKTITGKVMGNDEPLLSSAISAQARDGWEFVSAGHSVDSWGFALMRREKK